MRPVLLAGLLYLGSDIGLSVLLILRQGMASGEAPLGRTESIIAQLGGD